MQNIEMENLQKSITRYMEDQKISQREFAAEVGMSYERIHAIIKGKADNITLQNLQSIAGYMDVSICELIEPDKCMSSQKDISEYTGLSIVAIKALMKYQERKFDPKDPESDPYGLVGEYYALLNELILNPYITVSMYEFMDSCNIKSVKLNTKQDGKLQSVKLPVTSTSENDWAFCLDINNTWAAINEENVRKLLFDKVRDELELLSKKGFNTKHWREIEKKEEEKVFQQYIDELAENLMNGNDYYSVLLAELTDEQRKYEEEIIKNRVPEKVLKRLHEREAQGECFEGLSEEDPRRKDPFIKQYFEAKQKENKQKSAEKVLEITKKEIQSLFDEMNNQANENECIDPDIDGPFG